MNPRSWTKDSRKIVWTVSENDNSLYCIYVHGSLKHEDVSLEEFYTLYNRIVGRDSRMTRVRSTRQTQPA